MYEEYMDYVAKKFIDGNGNNSRIPEQSFRKRIDHTKRVLVWLDKLLKDETLPKGIRKKELYIAAIFHDVGYITEDDPNHKHAIYSNQIFLNSPFIMDLTKSEVEYISYLILTHSSKYLVKSPDSPIELVLLIEADKMDEEGAMAICWDCMTLGATYPSSYNDAYYKIKRYAAHILNDDSMQTAQAKKYWKQKQDMVKSFLEELEFDLIF